MMSWVTSPFQKTRPQKNPTGGYDVDVAIATTCTPIEISKLEQDHMLLRVQSGMQFLAGRHRTPLSP